MKAKDQRLKWPALPGLISRTNIITDSSCACSARERFRILRRQKIWRPAESPGRRPGTLPEASAKARTSPASKPALVGADTSPQRFVRDCRCAEMPAVAR